jgi:outer membrane lipoprotein-sorting protein
MRLPSIAKASTLAVALAFSTLMAVAFAQPGPSAATASREFDELYRKGRQAAGGIKTLTARFTETTTSSLLTQPLVAQGTLTVQRPSRAVMRFTDPEQRTILIDGDRMTTVWPTRNLRQVSNIKSTQERIQKFLTTESPDELRRQFDVSFRDGGERPGHYQITLVPKRKQIRETLSQLELWVDRTSFLLGAIRMTFATGDTKTMTFEDVVPNATIEPGAFTIEP